MKKALSTLATALVVLAMASPALAATATDTEQPSDVEGLSAVALNGSVKLSWDEATDNKGIAGYQVHYGSSSVTEPGQGYDEMEDVGNVLEYVVPDLENSVEYYFSVIAYDAGGNESAAWATEASAIPSKDAGDFKDELAPTVEEAEALNKTEVKVTFSEAVVLPKDDPQDVFTIENDDTFEALAVTDAVYLEDENEKKDEKVVILTTAEQEQDANYKLTVGVDIEDKAGNAVAEDDGNEMLFVGSGEEKIALDEEGPQVVSVESTSNTTVVVNFNETVVLSIDPANNFEIVEDGNSQNTLQVLGVELSKNADGVEDAAAEVTVSAQSDVNYLMLVSDVTDEAGNTIDPNSSSAPFGGTPDGSDVPVEDLLPPEDVANFIANAMLDAEKYVVDFSWNTPEVNLGDSVQQILYMSVNKGGAYDKTASIDPNAEQYQLKDMEPGEYWFKLTQKDAAGNESEGVTVKVMLAETGPEIIGLGLLSLFLGNRVARKRKKGPKEEKF